MNTHFINRLPLLVALVLCIGIFVGAKMFGDHTPSKEVNKNVSKFREILAYIDRYYVDSTNTNVLTEHAIEEMLQHLDPHTAYLPAEDVEAATADLEGEFEGIGVEFQIFHDTLCVTHPLPESPAEKAGIRAGDKIVRIDGKTMAGSKMPTREFYKMLRGKKGSEVNLGVQRRSEKQLLDFRLTRDKIPTTTVYASYMIDKTTGYIKVARFGAKTHDEFKTAIQALKKDNMKQLIVDLRGNPGGYLPVAEKMTDELLAGEKLIVYTKGKNTKADEEYKGKIDGIFEKGAIIVLIDENSASASEIMAGALQDNDRALIVGRRSFGKGLVQRPISLTDGSELRLTIARYYTPSGRCIQKPYHSDNLKIYEKDLAQRAKQGEFWNADSIKFDENQRFKTSKGRTVYGGGGIMPDYFVAADTTLYTQTFDALDSMDILLEFAFIYAQEHKKELEKIGLMQFSKTFKLSATDLTTIQDMAKSARFTINQKEMERSLPLCTNVIKTIVARNIWHYEGQYRAANEGDEMVQKALTLFPKAIELNN